jgi:hypothetical protein
MRPFWTGVRYPADPDERDPIGCQCLARPIKDRWHKVAVNQASMAHAHGVGGELGVLGQGGARGKADSCPSCVTGEHSGRRGVLAVGGGGRWVPLCVLRPLVVLLVGLCAGWRYRLVRARGPARQSRVGTRGVDAGNVMPGPATRARRANRNRSSARIRIRMRRRAGTVVSKSSSPAWSYVQGRRGCPRMGFLRGPSCRLPRLAAQSALKAEVRPTRSPAGSPGWRRYGWDRRSWWGADGGWFVAVGRCLFLPHGGVLRSRGQECVVGALFEECPRSRM